MSLAAIIAQARRDVHTHASVDALYTAPGAAVKPVPLTVRHHAKVDRPGYGDIDGEGYVGVVENTDRLVFNREEMAACDPVLVLARNGRVMLTATSEAFVLDTQEPDEGPINHTWKCKSVR